MNIKIKFFLKAITLAFFFTCFAFLNGQAKGVISGSFTLQVNFTDEVEVGEWTKLSGSILVVKKTNSTYWLMQTDKQRTYYILRGINFLYNSDVQIKRPVNRNKLSNEVTPEGGLLAAKTGSLPLNWDVTWWGKNDFVRNNLGEFVKAEKPSVEIITPPNIVLVNPEIIVNPVVTIPPTSTEEEEEEISDPSLVIDSKIKAPVGVVMWDAWYRDYSNDENPKYDKLINVVTKNRLAATEYMDKFNVVPFYGQYHEPEKIKIFFNLMYSKELKRNVYEEVEKEVRVKFDKTQADTDREIEYYANAGFDFFCFNYYKWDSPLSEGRLQFVNSQSKRGMKMTFMIATNIQDDQIEYITDLMLQDYWFRIDNKPVLYIQAYQLPQLQKYKNALASKGGGDLYVVYYDGGNPPYEFSDFQKYNIPTAGSYTLFAGSKTAEEFLKIENEEREKWMLQFAESGLNLIPTLTTAFENLFARTSMDHENAAIIEKATLPQLDQKMELLKDFMKRYPGRVPAVLWYAGNEMLESGQAIVPTKKMDGTIDTSVLDTISKHLD